MVDIITLTILSIIIGYAMWREQRRLEIQRRLQMIREALKDFDFTAIQTAFAEFSVTADQASEGFRRMGQLLSEQCECIAYAFGGVGEVDIEPMYSGCIRTLDDGNRYFPCRAPTSEDSDFCNSCLEELRASLES